MKRAIYEMKCDACGLEEKLQDEAYIHGWRRLTVKFEGDPYPAFEGDTCPACTEKHQAIFAAMRPGAEAMALLGASGLKQLE